MALTMTPSSVPREMRMPNPVRCFHCTKLLYRSVVPKLTRAVRTAKTDDEVECSRCGKWNYVIGRS
jgi:phage FluMu protein Com